MTWSLPKRICQLWTKQSGNCSSIQTTSWLDPTPGRFAQPKKAGVAELGGLQKAWIEEFAFPVSRRMLQRWQSLDAIRERRWVCPLPLLSPSLHHPQMVWSQLAWGHRRTQSSKVGKGTLRFWEPSSGQCITRDHLLSWSTTTLGAKYYLSLNQTYSLREDTHLQK